MSKNLLQYGEGPVQRRIVEFETFKKATLINAKATRSLLAAVPAATGCPPSLAPWPNADDPEYSSNKSAFDFMSNAVATQRLKQQTEIKAACGQLFAHVITLLAQDALGLVLQHSDYPRAAEHDDIQQLFGIIETIFSTPEGGNYTPLTKAYSIDLVASSPIFQGETLQTYRDRLARAFERCKDDKLLGKGVDDAVMAVWFLRGLSGTPCYVAHLKSIKDQAALRPTSHPATMQAAIDTILRLGGPIAPPAQDVPALAATTPPIASQPPSSQPHIPTPRRSDYCCSCCKLPGHFEQYCPTASAAEKAKFKQEFESRRDKGRERDSKRGTSRKGDKRGGAKDAQPKAADSNKEEFSTQQKALMAIGALVMSQTGGVPGFAAIPSAQPAPSSFTGTVLALVAIAAIATYCASLTDLVRSIAAVLIVVAAAVVSRRHCLTARTADTEDFPQPPGAADQEGSPTSKTHCEEMPELLNLKGPFRRPIQKVEQCRGDTDLERLAFLSIPKDASEVPPYMLYQEVFHDTGAGAHVRGALTKGEQLQSLRHSVKVQGTTGDKIIGTSLPGPDAEDRALYVAHSPNLLSPGLLTSKGNYETVDLTGRFRFIASHQDGKTYVKVFIRDPNRLVYPMALVLTVEGDAVTDSDVTNSIAYKHVDERTLRDIKVDAIQLHKRAEAMHVALAKSTVLERSANSFNSVEENEKLLTGAELTRAKIASMIMNANCISPGRLRDMLESGSIADIKLQGEDVSNAIKTYGVFAPKLMTNSRSKAPHTEKGMAEVQAEQRGTPQTGFFDALKTNGLWLWLSSWLPSKVTIATKLKSKQGPDILQSTLEHVEVMKSRGHLVPEIQVDGEPGLHAAETIAALAEKGIRVHKTATAAHNVIAEGNIGPLRTALNCALLGFHQSLGGVPSAFFDAILIGVQNRRLYAMPPDSKTGLSPGEAHFRRAMTAREATMAAGQFVYCNEPKTTSTSKNELKAQPAIFLGPLFDANSTGYFYLINDGKIFPRELNEATMAPVHQSVKDVVKKLCEADKVNKTELEYPKTDLNVRPWTMTSDELADLAKHLPYDPPDHSAVSEAVMNKIRAASSAAAGRKTRSQEVGKNTAKSVNQAIKDTVELIRSAGGTKGGKDRGVDTGHAIRTLAIAAMKEPTSPVPPVFCEEDRGAQGSSDPSRQDPTEQRSTIGTIFFITDRLKATIACQAIARKKARHIVHAYNITVAEALASYPDETEESVRAELDNILLRTFRPMDWRKLKGVQILTSKMFCKEKWSADGTFEKIKSRLVGGGHRQNKDDYDDVSAPAVSITAIFILLAIAAFLGQQSKTVDIPAAYLNAPLDKGKAVYMSLDRRTSAIAVKMKPELAAFLDESGRINGQVEYALYGLVQSALLWYKHVTGTLISHGFKQNDAEACVFNKDVNGERITVAIYVDDMKIFSVSIRLIDELIENLSKVYGQTTPLTVKDGNSQSYIGMLIDSSVPGQFMVTMPKYIADVLAASDTKGTKPTPASDDLLSVDENSPALDTKALARFRSIVMTLFYLAKRTRPDTLTAVAFLSRRTTVATQQDRGKLEHLLMYLNGSRDRGILIKPGNSLQIYAYVDAAYGTHFDMKSHTGCLIKVGEEGSPVFCKSAKQHIVSRSSTEAELIALSDSASQVIWVREFMIQQGFDLAPATIFQDNMSTISLITNGRAKAEQSRHINIRYFWLKDRIVAKDVQIKHMPTDLMIADMLTKPLTGELFRKFRDLVTVSSK